MAASKKGRNTAAKDIEKVGGGGALAVPDFLAGKLKEDHSLDVVAQHIRVPRLKLIQPMSDDDLKDRFGEGTALVRPGDLTIAEKTDIFLVVPVFFFTDFNKWSDRRDKESPMIVERTLDPTSELASDCLNANKRRVFYDGQEGKPEEKKLFFRNSQHLNFLCYIYGEHSLSGQIITITMLRGEFTNGENWCSGMKMRRMPLWSQVWGLTPMLRKPDASKKWWGLDHSIPQFEDDRPHPSLIMPDESDFFEDAHFTLKEAHDKRILDIEGEVGDDAEREVIDVDAEDSNEF